jgi:hypothetical protein
MYNNEVLDLAAGSRFGGHRIESEIGRGGMGVVYLAVHERLKQRRALKVIAPEYGRDEEFRRRFQREWEVAGAIDHPHVIPVYDAGEDEGQLYIAMRFVDGIDMRKLITREGRLSPLYTAEVVAQVASALDAAHSRGLIHRDIKPANVLICDTDDGPFAYLTDFGLTKGVSAETSGITKTGVFVGTLDYIAPEQLDGVVTSRSDIYALGCLSYHALSGQVPYPQQTAPAKMWAHVHAPPPHLAVGGPQLADAVARAMAKNPDDRFNFAGELGQALQLAAAGSGSTGTAVDPAILTPKPEDTRVLGAGTGSRGDPAATDREPSPRATPPARKRPPRRRAYVAALAALLALVGGALIAIFAGGDNGAPSPARRPAVRFSSKPFGPIPQPKEPIEHAALRLQTDHAGDSRGISARDTAQDGTGGVIEAEIGKRGHIISYPMALNTDGRFVESTRKAEGYPVIDRPGDRPPGMPPPGRTPFKKQDETALRFVKAVRSGDCKAFYAVFDTTGVTHQSACRRYLRDQYANARADFRRARPVDLFRLGATTNLTFYGVRAGRRYRTITLRASSSSIAFTRTAVISMWPRRSGLLIPRSN